MIYKEICFWKGKLILEKYHLLPHYSVLFKKMKSSNRFFFFFLGQGWGCSGTIGVMIFFNWGIGALPCVSAVQVNQLYLHAYPLPLGSPPTHLGHHRTLSWDPCAIYLLPTSYLCWRRKWQPTPAFLPGESQGWGSLVGCRLWGRTESDTTKATWQ